MVFISQADPGFDETTWDAPLRDPLTLVEDDGKAHGFHDFLVALRDEVIAFRDPSPTCTATPTTSAATSRS